MIKSSMLIFSFVALLHPVYAHNSEDLDFNKILSQLSSQYVNYCGHDTSSGNDGALNYSSGNWPDYKSCLADGRVHLVYANDAAGDPKVSKEEEIKFTEKDKEVLLNAILEGATLYVKEHIKRSPAPSENYTGDHIVTCVDAAVTSDDVAICSTTSNLWPFARVGDNRPVHRFMSNGTRTFQTGITIPATEPKMPQPDGIIPPLSVREGWTTHEKVQSFSWYIRY